MALIHVGDSGFAADTGMSPVEFAARVKKESEPLLAAFYERLSLPPSTFRFAQTGAPAATIVKSAKEWPADLIVIASHGRTGMPRALLGSVAEGSCGMLRVQCWSCARKPDGTRPERRGAVIRRNGVVKQPDEA